MYIYILLGIHNHNSPKTLFLLLKSKKRRELCEMTGERIAHFLNSIFKFDLFFCFLLMINDVYYSRFFPLRI